MIKVTIGLLSNDYNFLNDMRGAPQWSFFAKIVNGF